MAAQKALANGEDFSVCLWTVNVFDPVAWAGQRPVGNERSLLDCAVRATPEAAPFPIFRLLGKVRAQGIAFYVTQHLVIIVFRFNGKRLKSPLIEMPFTNNRLLLLPARNMRDCQSVHEGGQVAVGFWPQDHVPVIGQKTIGTNPHRTLGQRLFENRFKRTVVTGLVE